MSRIDLCNHKAENETQELRSIKVFLNEELSNLDVIMKLSPSSELLQAKSRLKEAIFWIEEHLIKFCDNK